MKWLAFAVLSVVILAASCQAWRAPNDLPSGSAGAEAGS